MEKPAASKGASTCSWFFEFSLALSAILLTCSLSVSNGNLNATWLDAISLSFLSASLVMCALGILWHDRTMPPPGEIFLVRLGGENPTRALLWLSCFLQLFVLCTQYTILSPLFITLVALCAVRQRWWKRAAERTKAENYMDIIGLATFLCAAMLLIRATDSDLADVMVFQRDSVRALLAGHNPYALTFPLPDAKAAAFYGSGLVVEGRTQFGYPYLPVSLLWVTPFQFFAGDFRYGHLAALTIAVLCIANFTRQQTLEQSRTARLTAMALAFSAPSFFVIQIGWTEPVSAMLFCLFLWLHTRSATGGSWSCGWLLASKQYLVLLLPLLFLLPAQKATIARPNHMRMQWKRFFIIVTLAAITILPFVIWNASAFFNSAYLLHLRQQMRLDSLSYAVLFTNLIALRFPAVLGFGMTVGALIFCGKYAPRSSAGFAASAALTHYVFFAFNKQAFTNYYFLVLTMLCCAVVASKKQNNTNDAPDFQS